MYCWVGCGCGGLGGCSVWGTPFDNCRFTVLIWWLRLLWLFGLLALIMLWLFVLNLGLFGYGFVVVWVAVFYWLLCFSGGWVLCMLLDFVGVCDVIVYGFCNFVVGVVVLGFIDVDWCCVWFLGGWRCWAGVYLVILVWWAILWLVVWVVVLLFCGLSLLFGVIAFAAARLVGVNSVVFIFNFYLFVLFVIAWRNFVAGNCVLCWFVLYWFW